MVTKRLFLPAFLAVGLLALTVAHAQETTQPHVSPQPPLAGQTGADESWNRGSWDGSSAPATEPAPTGAREDRWWDWAGGDDVLALDDWCFEDDTESSPQFQRWSDPGAIPGPPRDSEEDDLWSQRGPGGRQNWGYVNPESSRQPHKSRGQPYSYGSGAWSDTNRYDQQAAFVDWWDS